jgi:hypothetical protein
MKYLLLTILTATSSVGCMATSTDDATAVATDDLTAAAAARKTIRAALPLFGSPDPRFAIGVALADVPASVKPALQAANSDMAREFRTSFNSADVIGGIYRVVKTPRSRAVVGYAVWFYGDNGDAGRGVLRGFDTKGKQSCS